MGLKLVLTHANGVRRQLQPAASGYKPSDLDLVIQYDAKCYFTAWIDLGRVKEP